jgi:hypothetical protein
MKMIFVTDQHHMNELEQRVVKVYGSQHPLRLIGDITPTQVSGNETLLKRKRRVAKEIKKKKDPRFMPEELPFELNIVIDEDNINKANKNSFLEEWVCFYGGASISNLARKYYVHTFSGCPTICLRGSEPVIDSAQMAIYNRVTHDFGVAPVDVIKFVLGKIKRKQLRMYEFITGQLKEAGIKGDVFEFILNELSVGKYGGRPPLSSDVFRGSPH